MSETVSYVLATSNRRELLVDALDSILEQDYADLEVIVVSNGSTDGTGKLFETGGPYDLPEIEFLHFDSQLGVSEARNVGYRKASGSIIFTIDDDAILQNRDATSNVVSEFERDETLGIASLRIKNFYSGRVEPGKIPTRDSDRTAEESFECAYFLGGGNAIRANVFETVGYYPSDFTYSFEELDLSYRAMDAGFKIRYVPSATVIHKAEPKSEDVPPGVMEQYLTNRVKVAIRNLPWRYVVVSSAVWSVYALYRTNFDIGVLVRSYLHLVRDRSQLVDSREPVSRATIRKIRRLDGPLWK